MPAYGPLRHLQVTGRSAQVAQRQAVPATEVKGTVSLQIQFSTLKYSEDNILYILCQDKTAKLKSYILELGS